MSMTENEAIKELKEDTCYECSYGCDSAATCSAEPCIYKSAIKMAIQALEDKALKEEKQNKCKECAGCTAWLCECANERGEAIDELLNYAETHSFYIRDRAEEIPVVSISMLKVLAEQMKAGSRSGGVNERDII